MGPWLKWHGWQHAVTICRSDSLERQILMSFLWSAIHRGARLHQKWPPQSKWAFCIMPWVPPNQQFGLFFSDISVHVSNPLNWLTRYVLKDMIMIRRRSWMSWNSDPTQRNDLTRGKNHLTRERWSWTLPPRSHTFRHSYPSHLPTTAGQLDWYNFHQVWGIHFFIEITRRQTGLVHYFRQRHTHTKLQMKKKGKKSLKIMTIPKVKGIRTHWSLGQRAEQMSRFSFWLHHASQPSLHHASQPSTRDAKCSERCWSLMNNNSYTRGSGPGWLVQVSQLLCRSCELVFLSLSFFIEKAHLVTIWANFG